jgi:hypothetical protein
MSLFLFFFLISFIIFYLDNFKLSLNRFVKIFQILSFFSILLILIGILCNITNFVDIIFYVGGKSNDEVHLHSHISVDKEAAKSLGQGLSTIGSQLGLGATIGAIGTAVGKVLGKTSMPPVQKIGAIVTSGLIAGIGHSIITKTNRNSILSTASDISTTAVTNTDIPTITNSSVTTEVSSTVSKFINDSQSSPLQDLLFQFEIMNYLCLGMMYILVIQIIFKLHVKNDVKLNLSRFFGEKFNSTLEYYLNKIINLNQKMSTIYI